MIRNMILDWSGTLVDDLPAVWEASNHVLRQAGRPAWTLDQFRTEFRLPVREHYERLFPGWAPAELEGWFHERFREVQHQVTVLPHARDFLEFCRDRGCRVTILTTVPEPYFQAQAKALGLDQLFQEAWSGVDDKRIRLSEVLSRGRLEPRETVMVGDMEHDIEAARAGGVWSCAVLTGYNRLRQLRASGPDLIVEHLGELQGRLERQAMEVREIGGTSRMPVPTVGALIRHGTERWLMVRTRKWSDLWGIPGGKIKYGETSETALRREILEETGLEVRNVRFVLVQDCVESTEFYRPEHFLLLNYVCECAGPADVRLDDEAQEHRWVTTEEALELALNTPTRVLLEAVGAEAASRGKRETTG
jgi:phosphoglycolate phosphatase-like HAD superfamily hydrolase/ADP-ribose pyrophosphatase YjhB (NUDIX family)